ncbi:glutamyl-tRNA(Gln) amidotransferase, A subunit [candidate division TM7 genomosp. GTL1]|nr:glutamyl-tRNA(Gln) amidotransferase, A subunit [candidate division TM7 genomosp. GTL1]
MSSIETIATSVRSGEASARSLVDEALKKAEGTGEFNIFISLSAKRAQQRADEIDSLVKTGKPVGRLAGVPFVAKDNFLAFGAATTAASHILNNFEAPFQATAIEKLEAEGAICIGKANLDAFAHGGSTENSAFGPTRNAYDKTRVAGGSSGGSAVSVALEIVPFALGTDTGGSIRQPASFNGVVGVKPTYGTVSRYGVVAMASSTDTIGPITKTIADAELIMDIMAGRDANDSTTLPDFFKPAEVPSDKKRIGIVKQFMDEGVDTEVREIITRQIDMLKSNGHTVEEVDLPMVKYSVAMYYIIVPAEIASNLARFDGIRYGRRSEEARTLDEIYGKSRDEGFMDENKRRIMVGNYVLSSGYFDAYYRQAQKARTLLIRAFDDVFSEYDFLLGPVAPTSAFKVGENTSDPIKMYLSDVTTAPANLAGLPAMSVPAGKTETGLPVGLQLIGSRRSDAEMLAFAKMIEEGAIRG